MASSSAESSVTASPQLMERFACPTSETSPTPATHSSAAVMLKAVGRFFVSAQAMNGTSTQYSPVRNELFAAVVSTSPSEFAMYPAIMGIASTRATFACRPKRRNLGHDALDEDGAKPPDGCREQQQKGVFQGEGLFAGLGHRRLLYRPPVGNVTPCGRHIR